MIRLVYIWTCIIFLEEFTYLWKLVHVKYYNGLKVASSTMTFSKLAGYFKIVKAVFSKDWYTEKRIQALPPPWTRQGDCLSRLPLIMWEMLRLIATWEKKSFYAQYWKGKRSGGNIKIQQLWEFKWIYKFICGLLIDSWRPKCFLLSFSLSSTLVTFFLLFHLSFLFPSLVL